MFVRPRSVTDPFRILSLFVDDVSLLVVSPEEATAESIKD